jgi:hypothetical protein
MQPLLAADFVNLYLNRAWSLASGLSPPAMVGLALAGGFLLFRLLGNSRAAPGRWR